MDIDKYLCELFNSKCEEIDIYNIRDIISFDRRYKKGIFKFLYNDENHTIINKVIKRVFIDDCNMINNMENNYFDYIFTKINPYKYYDNDYYEWFEPLITYTFLNIVYGNKLLNFNIKLNSINELEYDINLFNNYKFNNSIFYRGQADKEWNIVPSMYRDSIDNTVYDINYINYLLNDFIDKYNNTLFDINKYNQLAYAQHSISFSPLLDLTNNPIIATSFALSNITLKNSFNNIDSIVYCFKVKDDLDNIIIDNVNKAKDILNSNSIIYLKDKNIKIGKEYEINKIINGRKIKDTLKFETFKDIIKALIPKFCIFKIPTNDRMKYQQGSFLYFYGEDTICLNGRIFYEFIPNLEVTKLIIKCSGKNNILDYIYKYQRCYDLLHLMDPYKYFGE